MVRAVEALSAADLLPNAGARCCAPGCAVNDVSLLDDAAAVEFEEVDRAHFVVKLKRKVLFRGDEICKKRIRVKLEDWVEVDPRTKVGKRRVRKD